MRAVTSDIDASDLTGNPAENFVRVLDQFAALRTYASAKPAVGGYRVLTPHREPQRTLVPRSQTIAALARARMRLTGVLSVMFVGGLGLAVLAGPASCPCSSVFSVADKSSLSRLGYVQNAAMMSTRDELPILSTAALVEPEESATGVSAITTSALEPSREVATLRGDDLDASTIGRLPVKVEQLTDAAPATIRLAAASIIESDLPATLPVVEVAMPPMAEEIAAEPEREPVAEVRSPRKRTTTRAYRKVNKPSAQQVERSPKWAQQMFVTPWQSKAFSYTQ
jgi:hypothetical protein